MRNKIPKLIIIIPCYNEESVLPETLPMFKGQIESMIQRDMIDNDSRILFVNDGSTDDTWNLVKKYAAEDKHICGICQSRNRGHQNAVLAGLMEAKDKCDITISIDCDGQDDIFAMSEMIRKYTEENCEIVYGVRSSRRTDSFFKRFTAQSFYKILAAMGADVVYNHADYRLISSKVLQEFAYFREVNLFLRGMIPLVGFKSGTVEYERHERIAGKSHYPLKKMIALAVDGITSLSVKPLRLIAVLGTIIFISGFAGFIYSLVCKLSGITLVVFAMAMLSGIQMVSLGIIGEYVGKIYMETKQRPRYIISEKVGID